MRRNFIGEKDLSRKAGSFNLAMAVVKSGNKGSIEKSAYAIRTLAGFIKEEFDLKNLAKLEREHMATFAEHLREKVNTGEIALANAANIVSCLNTVFNHFGRDDLKLSAKEEGLSRGPKYDNKDKSVSAVVHDKFLNYLNDKLNQTGDSRFQALKLSVQLQRELGLRFKESTLFDGAKLNKSNQTITIVNGTKGGQARQVPVTEKALNLIKQIQEFRKENNYTRSLIPDNMNFKIWQTFAYHTVTNFNNEYGEQFHYHGERHHYAQERYKELTGVEPPAKIGLSKEEYLNYAASQLNISINETVELIKEARLIVSEELGHHRLEITNSYLGR